MMGNLNFKALVERVEELEVKVDYLGGDEEHSVIHTIQSEIDKLEYKIQSLETKMEYLGVANGQPGRIAALERKINWMRIWLPVCSSIGVVVGIKLADVIGWFFGY